MDKRKITAQSFQRFICLLCAGSLIASMLPSLAWAHSEKVTQCGSDDAPFSLAEESITTFTTETSAQALDTMSARALDADGFVALKKGSYIKWIDRIDVPAYVVEFYRVLEEASDGDGYQDFLIDDQYIEGKVKSEGAFRCEDGEAAILMGPLSSESWSEATLYAMAAVAAFDRDHPEVFWLQGQYQTRLSFGSGVEETYLRLVLRTGLNDDADSSGDPYDIRSSSYTNERDIRLEIDRCRQRVNQIVSARPEKSSVKETLSYFNMWLTHNNEYNTTSDLNALAQSGSYPLAWECVSALEGREGARGPVCEGYARAFKMLCDKVGIPCVLTDGWGVNFSGSGPHMWNDVQVDSAWYAVDVTWNDPAGGNPGKRSGIESEEWFLLGSESLVLYGSNPFSLTHQVRNLVFPVGPKFTNGPVLSKTAYGVEPGASKPDPNRPADNTDEDSGNANGSSGSSAGAATRPSVPAQPAKNAAKKPTVPKAKLAKVRSAKKKTATVQWKKARGKVSGYQVQMALNKKFKKGLKKQTVKKAKTTKVTIKKLKSKKTYYVRVRAYYKMSGKTYYGKWSAVKKVRVK